MALPLLQLADMVDLPSQAAGASTESAAVARVEEGVEVDRDDQPVVLVRALYIGRRISYCPSNILLCDEKIGLLR